MNSRKPRRIAAAFLLILACSLLGHAIARPQTPVGAKSDQAKEEREACIKNLTQIYTAIEAFERDNKELPNWLSDLVPRYIEDATILVCPVCKRTGRTEVAMLADPKLPSSYLFEFCPLPLGNSAPNAPNRTRREWKRRQMGLLGSVVPVVRCRFHNPILNVAFDGKIYDSPGNWEWVFTNRVSEEALSATRLFSDGSGSTSTQSKAKEYPKRDSKAPAQLIDLSRFYNALLIESWHGNNGNDLAGLPQGIQTLGDVSFDVRGIVQLAGKGGTNFPMEAKGIKVRQKCKRLHFLHAAGFGALTDEGKTIGSYVIHFATNQIRMEIPIEYGKAVRNWHKYADEPPPGKDLRVAWTGENAVSKREGRSLRLFVTTWTNLLPDFEIDSIDFVSSMEAASAPFLIAITTE